MLIHSLILEYNVPIFALEHLSNETNKILDDLIMQFLFQNKVEKILSLYDIDTIFASNIAYLVLEESLQQLVFSFL